MHELERAEAGAFATMWASAPRALAREHGFELARIGDAVCGIARSLPGVRDLNRVCGADATTDPSDVLRVYDGLEHIVAVAPGSGELAQRLEAAGYTPGYPWMKFSAPADPGAEAPTDLRIEAVEPDRAMDFAGPVVGGFGMPPFMRAIAASVVGTPGWTCLAAYDGSRPVSAAALFVTGDQGWLGMGATLPEARGRGAQSALLATRIRLAAEQGATAVTTETGVREEGRPAGSYRNILRAGLQEAFERPNWVSP
jgi:GNAT superfamily N-acetyltransferase